MKKIILSFLIALSFLPAAAYAQNSSLWKFQSGSLQPNVTAWPIKVNSTTASSTFSTAGFVVGTNRFLVQGATGNVGIGTTSPAFPVGIAGTSGIIMALNSSATQYTNGDGPQILFSTTNASTTTKIGLSYINYPGVGGLGNFPDQYLRIDRCLTAGVVSGLSSFCFSPLVNEVPYYNPGTLHWSTEWYVEYTNPSLGISMFRPWGGEVYTDVVNDDGSGKAMFSFFGMDKFRIASTSALSSTVLRTDGSQLYVEGNLNVGNRQLGTAQTGAGITLAQRVPSSTNDTLYNDASGNLTWTQGSSFQGAMLLNTGNGGLTNALSVKRTSLFDAGASSQAAINAYGRASQSVDILNIKQVSAGQTEFNVGFSPDYKVGVGTTTPWAKFSVNPNALTSGVPYFVVGSSTATRLIVAHGGNVGVATTSPWRTLSVTGTVALSGLTTAAGTPSSVCINATTKEITENAALTCTVSSKEQKTNLSYLEGNFADLVMQIKPSEFAYKDQPNRLRYGFFAEDLQALDKKLADGYDKNGKAQSIDQNGLLSVTIKAFQEMYTSLQSVLARVTGLEKKFESQQLQINALEKRLKALEK